MAIERGKPEAVIHHSARSGKYTSFAFGERCPEAGVLPSPGQLRDVYDNAMAVFRRTEGWHNPRRRRSSIGYRSPAN